MTNLKPYFSLYTFGDEAETRSELARLSLAKLQTITRVSAGEVMIVGDAVADIEAARAVGAVSIAVATGFHSLEELARANPDYLWANLLAVRTDFLLDLVGG
jgi:phosphoglycolate phosphatase-like HAD superfamily hydrolase